MVALLSVIFGASIRESGENLSKQAECLRACSLASKTGVKVRYGFLSKLPFKVYIITAHLNRHNQNHGIICYKPAIIHFNITWLFIPNNDSKKSKSRR